MLIARSTGQLEPEQKKIAFELGDQRPIELTASTVCIRPVSSYGFTLLLSAAVNFAIYSSPPLFKLPFPPLSLSSSNHPE